MLLDPEKVHHFEDVGYTHDTMFECPANAPGGQLPESSTLGAAEWSPELDGGIGCRCECNGEVPRNQWPDCLLRLKSPNMARKWSWIPYIW